MLNKKNGVIMKDKRKIIALLFTCISLSCFCGVVYDANGVPHSTYEPDGVTMPSEMFDNSQNNSQNNFNKNYSNILKKYCCYNYLIINLE